MTHALRHDVVTDRWVVVAPARRGTPLDVVHSTTVTADARACPFCPGHEARTHPTRAQRPGPTGAWRVRAFANLYPMVTLENARDFAAPPYGLGGGARPAVGDHEVVVETPAHDQDLADVPDDHARDVVDVYRERLAAVARAPGACATLLFKNRGPRAGASLVHAHGQVLALPLVPPEHARRDALARAHHARAGRGPVEDARDRELDAGVRVVEATDDFVVYCPFASHRAFETWLVPRSRAPSLADLPDALVAPLGALLARTLRRFLRATGGADYNLVLRAPALEHRAAPWAAWHLEVLPRHVREAGFELSTGMHTTSALPEESAAALRAAG